MKNDISAFPMPSGPEPRVNEFTHYNEGMSLRDYFAAKAMQSLILLYGNKEDFAAFTKQSADKGMTIPALFASMAYENADAMLHARQQPQPETATR